jgi:Dolichyl-phosphate-mannose-protein mannosyltransferase
MVPALATKSNSTLSGAILAVAPALACWAVIFWTIPAARQNFPLNDDATYSAGLFALMRGEGVHYYRWAVMPQLGQWMWAAPFVFAFGPSFVVTRMANIALSLVGTLALYDLLAREANMSPVRAALGAALFSLNPLVFMCAGTFLTDMPALSFSLVSLALFVRGVGNRSIATMGIAAMIGMLAIATRQNAIVIPVVMAAILYWSRNFREQPATILIPLTLFFVGLGVALWFEARPDSNRPPAFAQFVFQAPSLWVAVRWIAMRLITVVVSLGVFAFPFAVTSLAGYNRGRWLPATIGVVCGAAAWTLLLWMNTGRLDGGLFPYTGNMLTPFGSFGDGLVLGTRPVIFGQGTMVALTLLGCFGAGCLIDRVAQCIRECRGMDALVMFGALHVPFLFFVFIFFDRYFIPLIPTIAYLCLSTHWRPKPLNRMVTLLLVGLVAVISTVLMHDWLAWNSARWELGRRAIQGGMAAVTIEGGYEWDLWYSIVDGRWNDKRSWQPSGLAISSNPWKAPGLEGRCALSFSEVKGTRIVDREPYQSWFQRRQMDFYLICLP